MTVALPILYTFRRCPYAMRARMALYAAGQNVICREVVLRDKPSHMLEISPKGTVPVLQLPGGSVIEESLEIMEWALAQADTQNWLDADKEETQSLIMRNDGLFKKALDRYKYPNRFPDEDCSGSFEEGAAVLKDLNERIAANGGYLLTARPTLADFAIFPFIRQFAYTDRDQFHGLGLNALETWLDELINSALFTAIMVKRQKWQEGKDPVYLREG